MLGWLRRLLAGRRWAPEIGVGSPTGHDRPTTGLPRFLAIPRGSPGLLGHPRGDPSTIPPLRRDHLDEDRVNLPIDTMDPSDLS